MQTVGAERRDATDIGVRMIAGVSSGLDQWLQDLLALAQRRTALPLNAILPPAKPVPPREPSQFDLQPSGTREFAVTDKPVRIGDTGMTVTVSDLSLPQADAPTSAGGKIYRLPTYAKAGQAVIRGTAGYDTLNVTQDTDGNTIVEASGNGVSGRLNLGKIAALTVYGLEGDDTIDINVNNYFGGITVEGGGGKDTVTVKAENAFSRGVTLSGGEGNDTLTLSGKALAAVLNGEAGNDLLDATLLEADVQRTRRLNGGAGSDRLYGTRGNDTLDGGEGGDLLDAGAGDDTLKGGAGLDMLTAGQGHDWLWGGGAADTLNGGDGHDHLYGEDGADLLQAGAGDDALSGGDDDDFLYAGSGADSLSGGAGADNLAPLASALDDIYAVAMYPSYLEVNVNGTTLRQQKLAAYSQTGKALLDYDSSTDFLVDANYLV